jgi:hypothetical protein
MKFCYLEEAETKGKKTKTKQKSLGNHSLNTFKELQ